MDRPLGPLIRRGLRNGRSGVLAGLLVALAAWSPAAADEQPGDDDPGPALAGTPVAGTSDGSAAPVLTTGRYLDRLPADAAHHYRLERTDRSSTFHVAVMFIGAGDSVGEGVRLTVGTTPGDEGCGSSGVFRPTQGEPAPVLFATVSTWTDVVDHQCATAEELFVEVGVPSETRDVGREVEILVYEEPPLSAYSLDLLEDPAPPAWVPLSPAPTPRDVPPGTTPTNAPVVRDGSYAVTLRPGRAAVLAVPLDWDQSLQAQLDATLPAGAPAPDRIAIDVVGPLLGTSQVSFASDRPRGWRTPRDGGGRLRIGAQSHVVAYTNRDSYDAGVNTESLAGIHYVLVRWTGTDDLDGAAADLRVPATVTVRTTGTAGDGIPSYTRIDGLIGPQPGSRLVDGTLQEPAAPPPASAPEDAGRTIDARAALAALAVAAAAGIALLVARVRRRHSLRRAARPGRHRG